MSTRTVHIGSYKLRALLEAGIRAMHPTDNIRGVVDVSLKKAKGQGGGYTYILTVEQDDLPEPVTTGIPYCPNCGGEGWSMEGGDCPACHGTGKNLPTR